MTEHGACDEGSDKSVMGGSAVHLELKEALAGPKKSGPIRKMAVGDHEQAVVPPGAINHTHFSSERHRISSKRGHRKPGNSLKKR